MTTASTGAPRGSCPAAMKLPWLVAGTGLSAAISFSSGGIEADDVTSTSPKNVHVIADPEPVRRRTRCRHDYYETRAGAKVFAAGAFMIAGSVWQGHVDQLIAIL